ncbi:HD domain-containing protein [Thermoflexus sp.]|uniref:HD domain-containing protein n=1 Tax=Thermoflexus sp. TaxID=1969742 RepID=UPI0025D68B74|nr:HD domain-containing protein [Thermoflexus sp.]MDW8179760.1 HD domain-containing protein [Anaerolineae bacterium]MCS6963500.1 HD domain-containing protein [Thermoflexus sp.]MCS7350309.1 HD domain-containing protein [Thermoflexus sp.]MCX7689634.1 HD domain-containing protein [Thermoflexus sp.]MDW8184790.1 HD domain-containing protein [Anaerolineae bacterium]
MSKVSVPRRHIAYRDHGVVIEIASDYQQLASRADATIRRVVERYPKTARMYDYLLRDPRVSASWDLANYMAVYKMNYNDHGPVHARVATAAAMQMMELLVQHQVPLDVVASRAGDLDDAFLVVLAAEMLHDIGNMVHRIGHIEYGVMLAAQLLPRWLGEIYPDEEQEQLILGFILSCIASHDGSPPPLTVEAAVVAIADGTDMTKGRGRAAFDLGKVDIHSVSALAVDEVVIRDGKDVPIEIVVYLSNSAGIFQVQEILARKVVVTPLRDQVRIVVSARPEAPLADQRIIQKVVFENGRFQTAQDD